jgi:hypothetical protein
MHELYFIEGTGNIDPEQINGYEYCNPSFYPEFQEKIELFKNIVKNNIDNKTGIVILRVYDGEFHFLNGNVCGNGPTRHYTKKLTKEFIQKFKDGCYKVDYISVQLNINQLNIYNNIFPDRPIDFPMDIIYGLFANRWLLKTFRNRIALIGGCKKIDVIKNLMKYEEYRNYLGNDKFLDYIEVPERFSCDNTELIINTIGEKIKESKAELFLFGIGISKMAIAWQFKQYKNAVFIDIGCGMSALAGTCGIDRPYFGNWINYRLKNYNYNDVDSMDFNINNGNVVYLD